MQSNESIAARWFIPVLFCHEYVVSQILWQSEVAWHSFRSILFDKFEKTHQQIAEVFTPQMPIGVYQALFFFFQEELEMHKADHNLGWCSISDTLPNAAIADSRNDELY